MPMACAPEAKIEGQDHPAVVSVGNQRNLPQRDLPRRSVWNRTERVFNSADGTFTKRKRPSSEWVRVEVPALRIISGELWEKVHAVNRRNYDMTYGRRIGGMNRTENSRTYLFSGTMTCGVCGGSFTVVGGKPPNVFYGCRDHRYRHSCSARTTIRRERLEQQLIAAISTNLLDPLLEEERFREFKAQLKATLELKEKLAREAESSSPQLEQERTELENASTQFGRCHCPARHFVPSFGTD